MIAICNDRWRLTRAAVLEHHLFAVSVAEFSNSAEATGDPILDAALSKGQTWLVHAKRLNLMSLYAGRAHRRCEKNLAALRHLQAERKAALQEAIEEAALLAHYAEMKGQNYNVTEPFRFRRFEFSTVEIRIMVDRWRRLLLARRFAAESKKPLAHAA